MLIQLLDPILRIYYNLKSKASNYLFTETSIIPHKGTKINYLPYFYYLLNYYCNNYPESFLNYFNYFSYYSFNRLYEVSYRDNGVDRASIIKGNMSSVFYYTRYNKSSDELIAFLKCNFIINNLKNNIRQIIRKYDTKTNVINMLYFHFSNDIDNKNNDIKLEIGSKIYNLNEIDNNMVIEDL